jgi:hypothetical protein
MQIASSVAADSPNPGSNTSATTPGQWLHPSTSADSDIGPDLDLQAFSNSAELSQLFSFGIDTAFDLSRLDEQIIDSSEDMTYNNFK